MSIFDFLKIVSKKDVLYILQELYNNIFNTIKEVDVRELIIIC